MMYIVSVASCWQFAIYVPILHFEKMANLSRGNSSVSDHNANTVVKRTHCHWEKIKGVTCVVQYLVAYLSSYHEKAVNTLCELAYKLPSICLPYQDGGIPPSVFHNDTTSNLLCR